MRCVKKKIHFMACKRGLKTVVISVLVLETVMRAEIIL